MKVVKKHSMNRMFTGVPAAAWLLAPATCRAGLVGCFQAGCSAVCVILAVGAALLATGRGIEWTPVGRLGDGATRSQVAVVTKLQR